jgi:hypothetical protein
MSKSHGQSSSKNKKAGTGAKDPATKCAEHGTWSPLPTPPASQPALDFGAIDPDENQRIAAAGTMTFTMVGCSGDPRSEAAAAHSKSAPSYTEAVAAAMIKVGGSSFFYHLGDITYTFAEKGSGSSADDSTGDDEYVLWNDQFYGPYSKYPKQIVSIPGNHDGKASKDPSKSQIANYMANFCAAPSGWPQPWARNETDKRSAMIQPYLYWRLDTPLAYIVGLYTNVVNGGVLDEPHKTKPFTEGAQYQWLVGELKAVAAGNAASQTKKAILLAVHYPPYSGAANFTVRGDQSKGPTRHAKHAPYLAVALQQAFADAGVRPDAIFSAHAHLFQRLTYSYADGTVMPCLIAGCGGHSPLETLSEQCDGTKGTSRKAPFDAVTPGSFTFPNGESARVDYYEDHENGKSFGFLQVTIAGRTLTGAFVDTSGTPRDRFVLDLDTRQYASP